VVYVLVVNADASCTIGIATCNFGVLFSVPNIFYVMYMYMHTCFLSWNSQSERLSNSFGSVLIFVSFEGSKEPV
jgi:hypothetical protein